MKICKHCDQEIKHKRNKVYCDNYCKMMGSRKEVLAFPDHHIAKAHEISMKNVLPIARNIKELKQWCKRATKRIMGSDINPY